MSRGSSDDEGSIRAVLSPFLSARGWSGECRLASVPGGALKWPKPSATSSSARTAARHRRAGRASAPSCDEWNTITEETDAGPRSGLRYHAGDARPRRDPRNRFPAAQRRRLASPTGSTELDRVTGGGIVPGSAMLIGGEPGIGKSTLLLQLAAPLAQGGSAARSISPARRRWPRCACGPSGWAVRGARRPRLGNQSRQHPGDAWPRASAPISSSSIRSRRCGPTRSMLRPAPSARCVRRPNRSSATPRSQGSALLLVGHVTKDGQIAGPKVIEHMVDTVLYFEGDRGHPFRILRAVKNRFGATRRDRRLRDGTAPACARFRTRPSCSSATVTASSPGSAVFAGVEGTRPLLVEIQALVAPSALGTPRRAVVGWDSNRLSMLLAVLEARCGVSLRQSRRLSERRRRSQNSRARGRSRRRRRPAVVIFRCCATARPRLLRRDLAIGGRPRRFPHDNATERGPQARLRGRGDTRRGGGRRRVRACRAHPDRSPQRTCGRVVLMPLNIEPSSCMRLHAAANRRSGTFGPC